MRYEYAYWYFKKDLSKEFCDKVIKQGLSLKKKFARTGGDGLKKPTKKEILKIRNSNITWLNDQWIYDEIYPYIITANKNAGWNFKFDWSENCQFTIYKKGQYYDWHYDSFEKPWSNSNDPKFYGKIRKLSVTIYLSDPKKYKGGELEFYNNDQRPDQQPKIFTCHEISERGSLVVFPSYIWHRVKPVTQGTRYSLVLWNVGYPYE